MNSAAPTAGVNLGPKSIATNRGLERHEPTRHDEARDRVHAGWLRCTHGSRSRHDADREIGRSSPRDQLGQNTRNAPAARLCGVPSARPYFPDKTVSCFTLSDFDPENRQIVAHCRVHPATRAGRDGHLDVHAPTWRSRAGLSHESDHGSGHEARRERLARCVRRVVFVT